ncbi:MAG: T9SS type A sorting domain-containing protein [Bacteroidales bacterium]|nr:T9SS type A sorting domain-containing protein [Bacteroidales bacterium]
MLKKLLALSLTMLLAGGLFAQGQGNNALHAKKGGPGAKTISFPTSDVQYWVGTGSNSAVVIIAWDDNATPTALVWGVHWNGATTATGLLDSIVAHDSRFSYNISNSMMQSMAYNDGTLNLQPNPDDIGWWCYYQNGDWGAYAWPNCPISNGDVIEVSESCSWSMTTAIAVTNPNAQEVTDASIDASDIIYWVGEGSNQVVFSVNWADTALAWGYRFNGESVTVPDMMDAIAAADPRFSYQNGSWGLNDINFITDNGTLGITPGNYWWSLLNHVGSMGMSDVLHDGDFYKWGDLSVAVVTDSNWVSDWGGYWDYTYVWPYTIHPVSIPPIADAEIAASNIIYWVGEGSNQVVFSVNWADTALAWGYRFNGESVTVPDMMDAIAAADPRFSYQNGSWGLDDINFITDNDTLGITPGNYWWSLLNHVGGMGMGDVLHDGDFYKWGDLSVAVITDSNWVSDWGGYWDYTYVWPYTIYPVSVPDNTPEVGPFCGAVGSEGCTAVSCTDSRIKGWATGCTLVRGSENISNPDAPIVSYGDESEAVGPATTSTMDVVSLGDGGYATLTFEHPIKNGEGYDFAVFENSFNDYFLELAFVEVSSDGVNFVRFPATSLTQTQTQVESHVDPTFINNLAGKYRVGYGTPFDLEELRDSANIDINSITHVRVIDVVGSIDPQFATYDAYGHMVNDPFPTITYSSGFDLDGICVLNYKTEGIAENDNSVIRQIYPNPAREMIHININAQNDNQQVVLYDMTGRQVYSGCITAGNCQVTISTSTLPNGVYMLRIGESVEKLVVRH